MDKFSDGFSDKSYDELLNEYAGESLIGSREPRNKANPAAPKKPVVRDNGEVVRPAPSVKKTASPPPAAQSVRRDFGEIQNSDGENKSKRRPVTAKNKSGDTMEFSKLTAKSKSGKRPVIEKFAAENSGRNVKGNMKKSGSKKSFVNKKSIINALKVNRAVFIGMAACIVIAIMISAALLSCVNDVLAIGRDAETSVEVVLPDGADTNVAVHALKDAGLIKNRLFCTVFIKAMKYKDDNYLPGVYYFTANMGVEKMIKRFKTNSTRGSLISITIPEGYTLDKIFERLEKNNICTAQALYKTINEVDFSKEYDFIPKADSKKDCYHVLEGYFFPATYEFKQGADPATVVRKFLDAFKSHWTEEYADKADELGMSVDEIITLASIVEKEGANAAQFKQISSVLHNRLNRSGLYPFLGCDSTKDYVTNTISSRVTSKSQLNAYILNYNTYEREGLPVGAICNPGESAIEAALYPENNQFYFFAHDNKKKIYLAETMEQHDQNRREIAKANAQSN